MTRLSLLSIQKREKDDTGINNSLDHITTASITNDDFTLRPSFSQNDVVKILNNNMMLRSELKTSFQNEVEE